MENEDWDAGPLDDRRINDVADSIARQNIIYIKGIAYELSSYSDAFEDGSRQATLRLWKPF
jgi:hypothetical protein